jgi:adenosylmethionine-8-amino-7-oxononanoate aminotransferase
MTVLDLQRAAKEHLWMHFTRMGGFGTADVPIIVRGEGCYLEDANGRRYLDALAGLFSVNIGYSFGEEIGQAALEQMRELPFYTNWSYAHPRAIELAAEVASLAPGDLNRVFFCNGGSEAVDSTWKLARQYYLARGEKHPRGIVTPGARAGAQGAEVAHDAIVAAATPMPRRYKAIARHIAYHGTTFGALSINGIPAIRAPFEPLVSEVRHVSNTNRYHRPPEETEAEFTAMLLEDLEEAILAMGPETICLVHMEPVQNAGGAFTPPAGYWRGVRELCDRYDILLSADEVITAFGRLGHWFASERYDIRPDIVCCAKGLSSAYAAIGAVVVTDEVAAPFLEGASMYSHGITFGGHPVGSAIALKNIEIMKREGIMERVLGNEDAFRSTLETLLDLPIVGDVRGAGYFYALELVKNKETRETFSDEECETLLRGFLSGALFERGLICRADDRGDPVIQISPPLVAGQAEFDEIVGTLGDVLAEAGKRMNAG